MAAMGAQDAYLSLEVPDDALVVTLAREAAVSDAVLASVTAEIGRSELDPGALAALALMAGRAGYGAARSAMRGQQDRLRELHPGEARAFGLARALVELRPPPGVEAAESGYRFVDEQGVLFVEDPIAAYWHHRGRWGPPLRPDVYRSGRHASGTGQVERCRGWAADGGVVVVTFKGAASNRPQPALRLCRAGFARDPAFRSLVRWSSLRSLGRYETAQGMTAAYQRGGEPPTALPLGPSIPPDDLLVLMEALSALGRGDISRG